MRKGNWVKWGKLINEKKIGKSRMCQTMVDEMKEFLNNGHCSKSP